jgi:hypothetical protein
VEIGDSSKLNLVSLLLLIAALAAIASGLAVQTFIASQAVSQIDDHAVKSLLARLAWLSTVLLALALVLLFWMVARLFRWNLATRRRVGPTPYVDAWSLAGQRVKLPDDQDDEDEEDQEEGGEDENGGDDDGRSGDEPTSR